MRKRIWAEYNRQLVERGSVTFLIDPKVLKKIKTHKPRSTGGRPLEFPPYLIELLLVVKIQYFLPYRALEGFARSIFEKLKCWLKMHVAVDEAIQEVIAESLTDCYVADSKVVGELLNQSPNTVKTVKADGAYDGQNTRELIRAKGATSLIPPPKNARLKKDGHERNTFIKEVIGLGGDKIARSIWGKLTDYSYRALVETAFSRYKRYFTDNLFSQTVDRQRVENRIKWCILNQMIRQA